MKAKALSSIVISILVVIVSVFVIKGLLNSAPSLKVKPSIAKPVLVELLELQKNSFDITIDGFGQVASRKQLEVISEVNGRIEKLYRRLEPGMRVEAGEKLLEIDQRNYKINVNIAVAQMEKIKALISRLDSTKSNLAELEIIHKASYHLQVKDATRTKKLFDEKMVSATVLEKALLDEKNRFEKLLSILNEKRLLPGKRKEAEADLASAKSKLNLSILNLEKTVILAPFSGNILSSNVVEGKYVNAGSNLIVIEDTDHLEVVIPVSVDDFKWLEISKYSKNGLLSQPVAVAVKWDDATGVSHRWKGRLNRIGGGIKVGDQTLDLYVDIDTPDSDEASEFKGSAGLVLKSGMFVSVAIPGKRIENTIIIPRSSLRMGGNRVFVMTKTVVKDSSDAKNDNITSGVLEVRKINVLRFQGEYALIASGLKHGDLLIVNPIKNVANGQTLMAVGG